MEMMGNTRILSHLEELHIQGCEKLDKAAILTMLTWKNFQRLLKIEFDEN